MPNMMDYLTWRGDLTLQASPWCLVDSLIMASMSYNPFQDVVADSTGMSLRECAPLLHLDKLTGNQYFQQWRGLLLGMAETERFGGMRMHDYVNDIDTERSIQFSAITAELSDGTTFVAYRGTDSTLVGWREDFNMSFETPVPAQTAAVEYLVRIAGQSDRPLRISGHSKGGNLAAYAAAHAPEAVQKRILSVCSFDGPGLDEKTMNSEGYARIRPVLYSVLPQSSIVGLLMNYHADYIVVRSTAVSIMQHDAFTWQLNGPNFEELQQVDAGSHIMDETVHAWLREASPEKRKVFVDAMFELLTANNAETTSEMSSEKFRTALAMLQASWDMEPETRKMFNHLIGEFLRLGAGNVWEMISAKVPRRRLRVTLAMPGSEKNAPAAEDKQEEKA